MNVLQKTTETASAATSCLLNNRVIWVGSNLKFGWNSVELFESLNLPTSKNATSRAENRWGNFSYLAMLNAVGPCMDLSVHVPNVYLKLVFNWLLTWKQIVRFPMDPNTVYTLESKLISMDGATQVPISEFEARWHNSRVWVWYFQGLQIPILPTGWHINFGQTGGDLSFWVPYPFQRHWPHGVFHQKMWWSRVTSSFLT